VMNKTFEQLAELSNNKEKLDSRRRFMIKDVIDLRANRWQPRRRAEEAKKLKDVHKEAKAPPEDDVRAARSSMQPAAAPPRSRSYGRAQRRQTRPAPAAKPAPAPAPAAKPAPAAESAGGDEEENWETVKGGGQAKPAGGRWKKGQGKAPPARGGAAAAAPAAGKGKKGAPAPVADKCVTARARALPASPACVL
jgi:hypothetical protein